MRVCFPGRVMVADAASGSFLRQLWNILVIIECGTARRLRSRQGQCQRTRWDRSFPIFPGSEANRSREHCARTLMPVGREPPTLLVLAEIRFRSQRELATGPQDKTGPEFLCRCFEIRQQ